MVRYLGMCLDQNKDSSFSWMHIKLLSKLSIRAYNVTLTLVYVLFIKLDPFDVSPV